MERLNNWSSCKKSECVGGLLYLVLPVDLKFYCSFSFPESLLCVWRHLDMGWTLGPGPSVCGKQIEE